MKICFFSTSSFISYADPIGLRLCTKYGTQLILTKLDLYIVTVLNHIKLQSHIPKVVHNIGIYRKADLIDLWQHLWHTNSF